jgi:hypothetical protein
MQSIHTMVTDITLLSLLFSAKPRPINRSSGSKSCDVVGDFARMRFEREMAGVEQMHLGVGIVAAKRFRAGGQKKCIAPACPRLPDQQSAVKDDVQIRRY